MRWIVCGVVVTLLAACAGLPRGVDRFAPRPVRELERWDVQAGDKLVGSLRLLEIEDRTAPSQFYQVLNSHGQWLGYVDAQGRVFQRVPFLMTEQFRGIHPMEKGLALLYEEPGPLRLSHAGGAVVDAAARRNR